jgi:hypothetical protein
MHLEGGCYCGKVRYAVDGEPMMSGQCHCRECQYITGGSPNVFMAFPLGAVTYTKGTPKAFMREDLDGAATREFCADCGTHMATRPRMLPAVIVKVGTLDDPSVFTPGMAIQAADKQAFHRIPEGIPVFERFPG